jgi:hypothetical protein
MSQMGRLAIPLFFKWVTGVAVVVLLGCSTTSIGQSQLLDFLEEGVTRKADVIRRLGDPSAIYDDSRTMTYRLAQDDKGWIVRPKSVGWHGIVSNLVVVFDDQDILKRHSLVRIRNQ